MPRHTYILGLTAAMAWFAFPLLLKADEGRFSLSVGSHDNLLILASDGQTVADLAGQTIGRRITVDETPFDVSFGRDANDQLTVILTSPATNSPALHFTACGKNIDSDKAVVTLTFTPDLKGLLVDPGYLGTVQVDSHVLRARSLADDVLAPSESILGEGGVMPVVSTTPVTPATDDLATLPATGSTAIANVAAPAPATAPSPAAPAPGSTSLAAAAASASGIPGTMASQLKPILPPLATASAPSAPPLVVTTSADGTKRVKLYWAEPVTGPDGTAPSIAPDEIRLVEVHGSVSVISPGGVVQAGTEGMVVPTGATVRTAAYSSAALFMGGVNSARLMPNCELVVTQALAGPVRTDIIDLQHGAVFSRVGHRDGETENYTVRTPEGTTGAETTDMLAYRGTPEELRAPASTGLVFPVDPRSLVAWNPVITHGLLSDVPMVDLGVTEQKPAVNSKQSSPNTYFYYANSNCQVDSTNIRNEVYSGQGSKDDFGNKGYGNQFGNGGGDDRGGQGGNNFGGGNQFGNGGGNDRGGQGGNNFGGGNQFGNGGGNDRGGQGGNNFGGGNQFGNGGWNDGGNHFGGGDGRGGHNQGGDCQSQYVLQQILVTLQPYNTKLKAVLNNVDSGTATAAELKFYHELTSVFFCEQEPQIVDQYLHNRKQFDKEYCIYDKVLEQDLCEFGLAGLTPH